LHYVGVKEDVTERKRSIDEREHLLAALERRVRALQCLATISNAIQQQEKVEDLFWEVLRVLPEGWRYSALVHLVYDGVDYAFPGFVQTADRLRVALKVGGAARGWVEVVYPQEHPRAYEGPFLREERELLETVARMLGQSLLRRESEEKLQQAREAAMEANRAKSLFLSNMSHEIRTPLNAILGFSEILYRDAAMGREQREKLQIVNRSGAYLLALINDVLELAKMESGRVVLQNSLFDLRRLVRDMGSLFQVRVDQKGLQLLLETVEPLPAQVLGDEGKIRRILVNLIGNALKFTDRGSINVRLAGEALDGGLWRLRLTVKDSGIGVASEDQEAIFGYFEQAYHQRHDRGGTGLGLAISREFARTMDGDISVTSRPGEGAEFLVTLVLTEGDCQEAALPQPELVAGLLPGQREYRILIATQVETDGLLLKAMLEQAGFSATVVVNKEELRQECVPEVDLVFADLALLQVDGYRLARELQRCQRGRELPVIAVSAGLGADEVQQVLLQQVRAVLGKPFTAEQVLAMVAAHTGAQYVYQELEKASVATWQGHCRLENGLRQQLLAATLDGDIERLEELLLQVEAAEPSLAAYARELAGSFRLDALAALWEHGKEHGDATKS
jgi:signal transduction histidine kinase/DNA-binding response OmpR family regulator